MNLSLTFLIFFISIVFHELSHIGVNLFLFKEWAQVKFSKTVIKIIPNQKMKNNEKKLFLGIPIIVGMIIIAPFIFYFPLEGSLALIAYLISCGMDFWNLVLLEVNEK